MIIFIDICSSSVKYVPLTEYVLAVPPFAKFKLILLSAPDIVWLVKSRVNTPVVLFQAELPEPTASKLVGLCDVILWLLGSVNPVSAVNVKFKWSNVFKLVLLITS